VIVPDASSADRATAPLGRGGDTSERQPRSRPRHRPGARRERAAAARLPSRTSGRAEVRAQLEEVRIWHACRGGSRRRRKVERDLHDGAQQQLLALSVRLQTARGRATETRDSRRC
jgi:hypothetical protein